MAATVILLLCMGAPAAAATDAEMRTEEQFMQRLAADRRERGLAPLAAHADLVAVARRHAERMAAGNTLAHNDALASEVGGWDRLGENVGTGTSAGEIHDAFMASDIHRREILDAGFTDVGVGVVVARGEVWVAQVFRQPERSRAAAARPAPTAAPPPAPAPARVVPVGRTPLTTPAVTPPEPAATPTTAAAPPAPPARLAGADLAAAPHAGGRGPDRERVVVTGAVALVLLAASATGAARLRALAR